MPGHRLTVTCLRCAEPFTAQASQVRRGRRYCGTACSKAISSPSDLLWSKVTKTETCWPCTSSIHPTTGYGRVGIGGRASGGGKRMDAHRLAWELVAGPIPRGLMIGHTCDRRPCVRNDDEGTYEIDGVLYPRRGHLWLGTKAANMADMHAKGRHMHGAEHWTRTQPERRHAGGERNPMAKLTEDDVREIRRRWDAGGVTMTALAREYGVSIGAISMVVHRKTWPNVE